VQSQISDTLCFAGRSLNLARLKHYYLSSQADDISNVGREQLALRLTRAFYRVTWSRFGQYSHLIKPITATKLR
jgi:hypothetical protein